MSRHLSKVAHAAQEAEVVKSKRARGSGAQAVDVQATSLAPKPGLVRSPWFERMVQELIAIELRNGASSFFHLLPAQGQPSLKVQEFIGMSDGELEFEPMRARWVGKLPADGKAQGTLAICVSGDQGKRGQSEEFARSTEYRVRVTLPDGTEQLIALSRSVVAQGRPRDAEYITYLDLSLPIQKGVTVIEAWPVGSSVQNFEAGRRLELFHKVAPPARSLPVWREQTLGDRYAPAVERTLAG